MIRLRWPVALLLLAMLPGRNACALDAPPIVSAEPAAILQLSSIDRLLEDVHYLLDAADLARYSDVIRGFLAGLNELAGLDRQRPLGALLFLDPSVPEREPSAVIFLPVTDVALLRATVMATGNSLEPTPNPQVFALRLGRDDLELLVAGGYGFILDPDKPPPAVRTERLVSLIEAHRSPIDATLTLRRAGLPETVVARALADLQANASREAARRDGESDVEFALRTDLQTRTYQLLGLVINEGTELVAGLDFGRGARLRAEVEFRSREDGELRSWWPQVLAPPDRLPQGATLQPALSWRSAVQLGPGARQTARGVLALARDRVLGELASEPAREARRDMETAFMALDETLAAGRIETRVEFLPTESGRFVLLAGAAVADAEALDQSARTLFPLAAQSGELREVALDDLQAAAWTFHRILGKPPRERDSRLYGPDLSLYFAAGNGAAWLAAGGREIGPLLAEALRPADAAAPAEAVDLQPPAPGASLQVRLRPWVDFALREGVARNPRVAAAVQQHLPAEAAIEAALRPSEFGVALSLTADEDYVRVLARLAALRLRGESP